MTSFGALLASSVLVGLASLYVWVWASQLNTPMLGQVQRWLRTGWRVPLVSCAWCTGFWLSVIGVGVFHAAFGVFRLSSFAVSVLASAAVCGFLGSFTSGISLPDE